MRRFAVNLLVNVSYFNESTSDVSKIRYNLCTENY